MWMSKLGWAVGWSGGGGFCPRAGREGRSRAIILSNLLVSSNFVPRSEISYPIFTVTTEKHSLPLSQPLSVSKRTWRSSPFLSAMYILPRLVSASLLYFALFHRGFAVFYGCPTPRCDFCLSAAVHDAPGIGFDLTTSYG